LDLERGFYMQANHLYKPNQRRSPSLHTLAPAIGVLLILAFWQGITMLNIYPNFIIPTPLSVVQRFIEVARDGRLWTNTWTTLSQMLVGLGIGLTIGILLGYVMAKSRALEDALSPLVLAFQSTPVVAYAPLLVIWFGSGPTSKIITSALIVFFPMLMNTLVGIRTVPASLRDLMRSLNATHWQMFSRLEVPAALPVLFGGLKVSAVLAVIGAVVGEFISSDAGLGYLINRARYDYDTPLVFVAILMLALIARAMYGVISLLERRALAWQMRSRKS
jgi:NitT/TauT family transport system permease protein